MNNKPYDPNQELFGNHMYSDMPQPGNVTTGQPVENAVVGKTQYPQPDQPFNPNYGKEGNYQL